MKTLAALLALRAGEVVSIAGCGGKTTLMWSLARHYRNEKVLVTTSTKIGRPPSHAYDSITDADEIARLLPPETVAPGVHLAGTLYDEFAHVKSLPLADLGALCPHFDKIFIEADGSKLLPVKGWAEHEPVIPDFTTLTIGIATIRAEGRAIDENTVHRPRLFCRIAKAVMGEALTLAHMAAAAAHPEGLMGRATGRKILLVNQLDDAAAFERARAFVRLLPLEFLHGLHSVIGTSLAHGHTECLWKI